MMVIVPNYVRDAINKKLDVELEKHPQFEKYRETLFGQLLEHFDRTGEVPDFKIEPR